MEREQLADGALKNLGVNTLISAHTNDSDIHLSEADRSYLNEPFYITTYVGNGAASREIELSFSPQIAFVIYRAKPFSEYDSSGKYTLCNAGIAAASGRGNSYEISMSGSTITVEQSTAASDGRFKNLNKVGAPLFYHNFQIKRQ